MTLSPAEVARLAGLARIALTEEECAELAPELDVILESVQRVQEVADPKIDLMTHAMPMTNVMRIDEVAPSLEVSEVLACAPASEDGRFRVPQILGEEA